MPVPKRWGVVAGLRQLHAVVERYHVEIEVSRDPERTVPGQVIQKRFSPGAAAGIGRFWVDLYDEPTLIATKLAALLGREVPRDVYDLDLLMAAAPPSALQVRWAIGRAGLDWQDHDAQSSTAESPCESGANE